MVKGLEFDLKVNAAEKIGFLKYLIEVESESQILLQKEKFWIMMQL